MNRFAKKKYFDGWNVLKKQIESSQDRVYFKEREVWWASVGMNIGDEVRGKNKNFERPVLIFKKFNNKIALVLPLSSRVKETTFYYNID